MYHEFDQRSKKCLMNTENRANTLLRNKYRTDEQFWNVRRVNEVLFNVKSEYCVRFKEYLLYEENEEMLKKFYPFSFSLVRLDKLVNYYTSNTQVYPCLNHLHEAKFLQENIMSKQILIDDLDEMQRKDEEGRNKHKNDYFVRRGYVDMRNASKGEVFFTDDVNRCINAGDLGSGSDGSKLYTSGFTMFGRREKKIDSVKNRENGDYEKNQINSINFSNNISNMSIENLIFNIETFEKEKEKIKLHKNDNNDNLVNDEEVYIKTNNLNERRGRKKKTTIIKKKHEIKILEDIKEEIKEDNKEEVKSPEKEENNNHLNLHLENYLRAPTSKASLILKLNKDNFNSHISNDHVHTDPNVGSTRGKKFTFKFSTNTDSYLSPENSKFKKLEDFIKNNNKKKEEDKRKLKIITQTIVQIREAKYFSKVNSNSKKRLISAIPKLEEIQTNNKSRNTKRIRSRISSAISSSNNLFSKSLSNLSEIGVPNVNINNTNNYNKPYKSSKFLNTGVTTTSLPFTNYSSPNLPTGVKTGYLNTTRNDNSTERKLERPKFLLSATRVKFTSNQTFLTETKIQNSSKSLLRNNKYRSHSQEEAEKSITNKLNLHKPSASSNSVFFNIQNNVKFTFDSSATIQQSNIQLATPNLISTPIPPNINSSKAKIKSKFRINREKLPFNIQKFKNIQTEINVKLKNKGLTLV